MTLKFEDFADKAAFMAADVSFEESKAMGRDLLDESRKCGEELGEIRQQEFHMKRRWSAAEAEVWHATNDIREAILVDIMDDRDRKAQRLAGWRAERYDAEIKAEIRARRR